jgi:hypothetical protein
MGYVFDGPGRTIRPIIGIPGAAYPGAALVSNIDFASVAPDGSFALVEQQGQPVMLVNFNSANPTLASIDGAIGNVDYFAWSPDASSAAVFSSTTGQVQTLSHFGDSAIAGSPIPVSGAPGQISALAVDGARIIVGLKSANAGGIYLLSADGSLHPLAAAASPSVILPAGQDLYFADSEAGQVWVIRNYAGATAATLLSGTEKLAGVVGMQLAGDRSRLYVADAGNTMIAVYDLASGALAQTLGLNFVPSGLSRFGNSSVFLMTAATQNPSPVYILADSLSGIGIYFVPAVQMDTAKRRVHPTPRPK